MSFKFSILGCGSSFGVPRADGNWGKCNPKEIKNNRTRCSALISFMGKNILIDTSPDLRTQLIRHKVTNINAVLYSHLHADQTHGINDLRVFYMNKKKKLMFMLINLQVIIYKIVFHIALKILMAIHQFYN